jgi:ribosomal protein L11 methyltransferase
VTLTAPAGAAERLLPDACDAAGTGCRERALPGDRTALDFWVPPSRAGAVAAALRGLLDGAGTVEERDEDPAWRTATRAFHTPVTVAGRLRVRPPWTPPADGLLDVVIDPGMAFGTGQHDTTRGCLELLCAVPPGPLVDVGCGSGVLAVAARRLGFGPVWALDNDPLCVEATLANARANGVALTVARRDLTREALPPAPAVAANLTATLLVALAGRLAGAPPRWAVLSGMRPGEVPGVLPAWRALGLREHDRRAGEGWATILLGPS